MKKIVVGLFALGLIGCSSQQKPNQEVPQNQIEDTQQMIDEKKISEIKVTGDLVWDISDPSLIYEHANCVVLATIQSFDGGDNYSEVNQMYVFPYSKYSAKIETVYKGDIDTSTTVNLYRVGATLPYEKYFDGLTQPEKDKINSFPEKNEKPDYIKIYFENDIELEVGKTYVLYLNPDKEIMGKSNEFIVFGLHGGAREVNTVNLATIDSNEFQVFNNFTQEWDSISNVIPNE